MPNRILISVADAQDLRRGGLPGGDEQLAPLHSLLQEGYDQLFLIQAEGGDGTAGKIAESVGWIYPRLKICTLEVEPCDLKESKQVTLQMQEVLNDVRAKNPGAPIHVSLSSGPPEIHVAWLTLLGSNGNQNITLVRANHGAEATASNARNALTHSIQPTARPPNAAEVAESLGLVGEHHLFEKALRTARMMAGQSNPILIVGEAGTGKTLFARYIHAMGRAATGGIEEFAVSGGAVSDLTCESILFGQGGKSGRAAPQQQPGLASLASDGTLVVDQPELLGRRVQEKLLELIEAGTTQPAVARLIFTTPQHLAGPHEGKLLPDLAQHLLENRIELPGLGARPSDIPLIAMHYLQRINEQVKEPKTISHDTLFALQKLSWPENIRSLREAVERAALLSHEGELTVADFLSDQGGHDIMDSIMPDLSRGIPLDSFLGDLRRRIMNKALDMAKGNKSEAARMLHLTPQALSQFAKQQAKSKDKETK